MKRYRAIALLALATGCAPPASDMPESNTSEANAAEVNAPKSVAAPIPTPAAELHGGRARVWVPDAVPASGEAAPEGRWGYADAAGALVIPAKYRGAGDFAEGRALVLLGDDYVFIDSTGTVVRELVGEQEVATLPPPVAGCADLACYATTLGAREGPYIVMVDPSEGERWLELEVSPLGYGVIGVQERGWEGHSHVLVLPHRSHEQALALLHALLRGREVRDVTTEGVFTDDVVTFEVLTTDAAAEYCGIRVRGASVAIHHTTWES